MSAFSILAYVSIFTVAMVGLYTMLKIFGVVHAWLFVRKYKDQFDLDFDKVSIAIDTPSK